MATEAPSKGQAEGQEAMTATPKVEALIDFLGCVSSIPDDSPISLKGVAENCRAALRSQAARIKELEAERDEAEVGAFDSAVRAGKFELRARKAEARVERLRGALEPFAKEAEEVGSRITNGHRYIFSETDVSPSSFTVGDLRTARATYEETKE